MQRGIDVLNLSIGGPDFQDEPFVDKVGDFFVRAHALIADSFG